MEVKAICFILEKFQEIERTKGTGSAKIKEEIIKSCLTFKEEAYGIFNVAFNPFWITHISQIEIRSNTMVSHFSFSRIVNKLLSVKAVNNDLREAVTGYVNSYPMEFREMLVKVLTKTVNIGISAKSINSALGQKLIPDVELMKCDKNISTVEGWFAKRLPVFAEIKYDGIRAFAEIKYGKLVGIKTYNMNDFDITKLPYFTEQLETLGKAIEFDHFFFDFEITNALRQTVSGEVTKLLKGTAKEGCDKEWVANIFDVHEWDIFEDRPSEYSYIKRRDILMRAFNEADHVLPNLILALQWKIESMQELRDLFAKVLEDGIEGLVVKVGTGVYELKYSKFWVKMKAEIECDLEITGWFQGSGKRANTIGGFSCKSSCGNLEVNVGSGFTDKMLAEIMANGPASYIGKIAEIRYNTVIEEKNSIIKSLFLPRFKRFRFDKNKADSLERILSK